MDVVYFKARTGNFGDDLNEIVWKELLPPDVWEAPDVALVGIGTILSQIIASPEKTAGKRVFVLGSGAGYAALPTALPSWEVLATRGPLTERIIGRPGTAATDSAAFLSVLPQVVTMNPKPDLTLFMPHYHSTWGANWARAAEEAGMTFVDPQWPTARILELFSRAKLMVCEAMHGAIVADTLRIPWIPVGISREFLPLKWCDWAMSVDVPFRPTWLPASSYWEKVRFLKMKKEAEAKGLTLPDGSDFVTDPDELIADFRQRVGKEKPSEGAKHAAPSGARLILRDVSKYITWPLLGQAIKALKEASKGQPYLSPDAVFSSKVQKLVQAKDQFVETVRKG